MSVSARQGILAAVAAGVLWNPSPIIAVQHAFGLDWLPLFQAITLLGTVPAVLIAVALVFWLAGRQLAYGLLGVVLVSALIGSILKVAIGEPRPHDPRIIVHAVVHSPSFPSGHSLTSATLWGMLAARRQIPVIVPILIVPLVMLSRLYLGVHYLGDVLGGALIGLVLVLVAQILRLPARNWLACRSYRFFVVIGVIVLAALICSLPFLGTSPEDWQTIGAGFGGVAGLLLEYQFLRYTPPVSVSSGRQALLVALGLGLLVLPMIVVWLAGGGLPFQATCYALAALWATLGAPAHSLPGSARPSTRSPPGSSGAGCQIPRLCRGSPALGRGHARMCLVVPSPATVRNLPGFAEDRRAFRTRQAGRSQPEGTGGRRTTAAERH